MKRVMVIVVGLLGALTPGLAMADDDDDCNVPMNQWRPREAVEQMAHSRGWIVNRIKIDDGCYEIRGQDENGHGFKAKVDPQSLAVIRMKSRSREHDEERGRRGAQPLETPSANGLVKDGMIPKVEIK